MKTEERTVEIGRSEIGDHLVGYRVEGRDGTIGKIEHVTFNRRCMAVRMGPPGFRKMHVLVSTAVLRVDTSRKRVFVDLREEDVSGAPVYDLHLGCDEKGVSDAEAYYLPILLENEIA